ncbi:restriction endonuclease subunit S [Pseudomonas sp. HR1]|uniref:restriction endonuclease subunit S n=1 Tax=Pseudomonas sp. HR1 TaxID=1463361 RepID=UPI00254372C9|nr:restriction endonuclease subunit S [Pseudomonas sp. HR1]MDK4200294.1 restriction endonuclease subunit S [Pseudomonas sp. HR1]
MSFESLLLEDLAAPIRNAIVGGPFGSNLVSKDYVEQGVPVIRGQNMGGKWVSGDFVFVSPEKGRQLEQNKARPGDVIFTQRGTLGQVSIVPPSSYPEYIVSQSQMKITVDPDKANAQFIYYLFRSDTQLRYILNSAIQTGVPHTNLGILRKTPVAVPSLGTQEAIAAFLGALDDRITLLRQTNATLEAIAQALFKSWFVDFDPVRAKAEGHQPEGMDATTAALFPDSFEESELGLVPKGWAEVRLGQLCTFQKGCSYKGNGLSDEQGAYMFNLGCFNAPRVYAFEKVKRYTGDFKDKHCVKAGDLIIANTDMTQHRAILGRPLLIPDGMGPGFVSHHVFKVVTNKQYGEGIKPFLFFCFLHSSFRERAVGYATGTTVLALPRDALEQHLIYLPSNELLEVFADLCEPIFAAIKSNEVQTQTLTQLRDTLLPRLISGQLRLPEAEA